MVIYHNDAIVFFCRKSDMSLSYVTVRVMFSTSPPSFTTDALSFNTNRKLSFTTGTQHNEICEVIQHLHA
jgi:hypothetical protein